MGAGTLGGATNDATSVFSGNVVSSLGSVLVQAVNARANASAESAARVWSNLLMKQTS
jgi:hypothetical protein